VVLFYFKYDVRSYLTPPFRELPRERVSFGLDFESLFGIDVPATRRCHGIEEVRPTDNEQPTACLRMVIEDCIGQELFTRSSKICGRLNILAIHPFVKSIIWKKRTPNAFYYANPAPLLCI